MLHSQTGSLCFVIDINQVSMSRPWQTLQISPWTFIIRPCEKKRLSQACLELVRLKLLGPGCFLLQTYVLGCSFHPQINALHGGCYRHSHLSNQQQCEGWDSWKQLSAPLPWPTVLKCCEEVPQNQPDSRGIRLTYVLILCNRAESNNGEAFIGSVHDQCTKLSRNKRIALELVLGVLSNSGPVFRHLPQERALTCRMESDILECFCVS